MRNVAIALAIAGSLFAAVPASAGITPATPDQLGAQTDVTQARWYGYHYHRWHYRPYYRHYYHRRYRHY